MVFCGRFGCRAASAGCRAATARCAAMLGSCPCGAPGASGPPESGSSRKTDTAGPGEGPVRRKLAHLRARYVCGGHNLGPTGQTRGIDQLSLSVLHKTDGESRRIMLFRYHGRLRYHRQRHRTLHVDGSTPSPHGVVGPNRTEACAR